MFYCSTNKEYLGVSYIIRRIDNNANVAVVTLSIQDLENMVDPIYFLKESFDNDHKFDVYYGSIDNLYAENIPVKSRVVGLY